ncbi:MAG: integration host factor subunit beta [Spirochaetales bacterium]|nr:integration host factor subunit beta [Spirochaetales bacterium]MDY5914648.1 HU family DNA-binding protein [Treponema sp.]
MKKLKKDLVNNLASKLSLEKDEITQIVDTVLDGVKEILSEGSSLEIRGFGTFEVKIRKGKKNARNPKTGEKVQTQPHYVICLKPGQELRDNIKKLKVID